MKKKIAILANGWNDAMLFQVLEGINRYNKEQDFDVFVFMSYAAYSTPAPEREGQLNVYKLCRMEDYDGVIVCSNMLNSESAARDLCMQARQLRVPVVSIGMDMDDVAYVGINNEVGMFQLVSHLLDVHQVKRVIYIGGTEDHVDSKARLNITRIVLASHGISLKDEDIYYGDWGYRKVKEIATKIMADENGLPDAIVCANDITALALASEFFRNGYRLPESVIITGFDHIEEGQTFYPALTTVTQNYEEVGYQCCRLLFDQILKHPVNIKAMAPSKMTVGQSCGCRGDIDYDQKHKDFCCEKYLRGFEQSVLERQENALQQGIAVSSDYTDLKKRLKEHFEENHIFEGENFYINICKEYFEYGMDEGDTFQGNAYVDDIDILLALKDGKCLEGPDHISIRELIPNYQKEIGVCNIYYVLALHEMEHNYGYIVWMNPPLISFKNALIEYTIKFQQAMKMLRTNIRLVELNRNLTKIYDKDPMTGLFNRFGYESKAKPLYEKSLMYKSTMMVMFVDINYMKHINDQFGHIHGDMAIRTVADAIKENIQEGWIAVRFGGDEFLIIAPECTDEMGQDVKMRILYYLEDKHNETNLPYRISTSIGYTITDPKRHCALQDYIKEADNKMYEVKREIHEKQPFTTE